MKKLPPRIRGTTDQIDLRLLSYVLTTIKRQCSAYALTEIATPILEPLDLFERSLGTETDVVSKEMYRAVPLSAEESSEQICLRPEGTAPILRAYLQEGIQEKPWKVFMYGPMFRHERPQKGRFRQFHQVSIEYLSAPSILYDAELISMLERLFHDIFGLDSFALAINFLGCSADRTAFNNALSDFIEKNRAGICTLCDHRSRKNLLRIFDCKQEQCQAVYLNAPRTLNSLCEGCTTEWQLLENTLRELAVSYTVVPTLVRGLDYYTKTVFEFVSTALGAQSTFCGGGRYDELSSLLGGQALPAVGAAIGIERLLMLLEPIQARLPIPHAPRLAAVVPLEPHYAPLALLLADQLRAANICCEVILDGGSAKSMLRKASSSGATYALIIGETEVAANAVMVKNMITGEQLLVAQSELVPFCAEQLRSSPLSPA
jgi:histidyl-tRNA synthetase